MPGAFGLLSDPHASHFPGDRIIEANSRLDVFWLNRIGALVQGTVTELALGGAVGGPPGGHTVNVCRRGSGVTIDGICVALAWDTPMEGVDRPWWSCPLGSARCRFVFLRGDTIACQRCLRLDYASRHLRRQTPGVGRVERLRRRLGDCAVKPFAPLPARIGRGRSRAYHDKLVAMIHDEEEKLLEHLDGVVHDLKRRIRVRKARSISGKVAPWTMTTSSRSASDVLLGSTAARSQKRTRPSITIRSSSIATRFSGAR